MGPLFMALAWYVFYLMSNALEAYWGSFRYTAYVLLWLVSTCLFGMIAPNQSYSSVSLDYSVFFAFAYLFPNFEFRLYFILPVKVKWLGWIGAGLLALMVFGSGFPYGLVPLGMMSNFAIFFGKDIVDTMRAKKRRVAFEAKTREDARTPFHRCGVCGATDLSRPDLNFRYRGDDAICEECLEKEKAAEA